MAVKANYSAEELLKKLIAFQSTSYNEQDIARWIQSYLEKQGVEVTRESFDPGRFLPDYDGQKTCNLYVDIGEGDEAVLFYGHLDVVEGPVTMFTPTKRDGWIRGRGAADMKAGVAGMIKAIERLDTDRRCLFHFVADEETSGTGARVAVEHLEEKEIDTVEAVMLEPSDDFDFIEQQGKGYAFCRVKGGFEDVWRVAHRAVNLDRELKKEHPVLGQNQIKPTKIVPHDILKEGNIVQGAEAHASRPEEGENSLINLIKQKREVEMAWTPSNSRNTLPATTKYVNGEPSLVPTVLYLDIRTMKGDHDMIMRRVKELCDGVELNVDDEGRPFLTPMDARIVQACQAAVPGATLSSGRGGSDASYYLETADNVISCFGPGQSRLIHTRKEAIREGMVEKTADVIERIIESY